MAQRHFQFLGSNQREENVGKKLSKRKQKLVFRDMNRMGVVGGREKGKGWDSEETLSGSLNHKLSSWKVREKKEGTWVWVFLVPCKLFTWQRSVTVRQRERVREREVWFSCHAL